MGRRIIASTCLIIMSMFGISHADLIAMTDFEMQETSGRFGSGVQLSWYDISRCLENIYYEDKDGLNGQHQAGYISLTGMTLKGRRSMDPSADAVHQASDTILGIFGLASMLHELQNAEIEIAYFSIGAIQVGALPGEGLSFGSITISDLKMSFEGKIDVTCAP